jgi:hypothetical protein
LESLSFFNRHSMNRRLPCFRSTLQIVNDSPGWIPSSTSLLLTRTLRASPPACT